MFAMLSVPLSHKNFPGNLTLKTLAVKRGTNMAEYYEVFGEGRELCLVLRHPWEVLHTEDPTVPALHYRDTLWGEMDWKLAKIVLETDLSIAQFEMLHKFLVIALKSHQRRVAEVGEHDKTPDVVTMERGIRAGTDFLGLLRIHLGKKKAAAQPK